MEEIDRGTIKALSADTRRKILKLLSGHRATGADISRMLGLSPSTVNEHLKKLEASSLVRRIETGHKWVYYDVSEKGHALLHSNSNGSPVQFVLVLSIGVLLFLGGAFFTLAQKLQPSAAPMMAETATAGAGKALADASRVVTAQPSSVLPVVAMLVGAVIIIVMLSSYYYKKK